MGFTFSEVWQPLSLNPRFEVGLTELTLSLFCVLQYRIGQLYMISKHSHEQSDRGEGVEVVQNEPYEDPMHGQGQFTEKRVYLNRSAEHVCRFIVWMSVIHGIG